MKTSVRPATLPATCLKFESGVWSALPAERFGTRALCRLIAFPVTQHHNDMATGEPTFEEQLETLRTAKNFAALASLCHERELQVLNIDSFCLAATLLLLALAPKLPNLMF